MNLPVSQCLIGLLVSANFCLISAAALTAQAAEIGERTASLRSEFEDGHELAGGARVEPPVNHLPRAPTPMTVPLQEAQPASKPGWSHRLRRLLQQIKEFWNSAHTLLRDTVMMLRYKANCLDRHKTVPIFSEIAYLEQNFGKVYKFYVNLKSPAEQQEFWEIFDKSIYENTKTIVQSWLQIFPRIATLNQNQRRTQQALLESIAPSVIGIAREMAKLALNTLGEIAAESPEYKAAEAKAYQLVKDFLGQSSNGATAAKVSREIRLWKLRHPSGKLKLTHPYQAHFAELFGPGEIAKPLPKDEATRKIMGADWGLTQTEMNALIAVSTDSKIAIGKLYAAQEIAYQFGFRLWGNYPKKYYDLRAEAEETLETAHKTVLAAFGEPEWKIRLKLDKIVKKRHPAIDIWADQTHSSQAYKLLPFIEPLRSARDSDYYPDITPVLQNFGLHTYPQTLPNLKKLSEELSEQFSIQYRHQMIARAFRKTFENRFDGGAQFCLTQILKQTMGQLKRNLAQPTRQSTTDGRNLPPDIYSPTSYSRIFKMWSRSSA